MVVVVGLSILLLAALLALRGTERSRSEAWDEYFLDGERTFAEKAFSPLAQRFSSSPLVTGAVQSRSSFEALEKDLKLGNSFGRSLEVFLSVQIVALFFGAALLLLSLSPSAGGGNQRAILMMSGLIAAYLPYYRVRLQASRKEEMVLEHLPRFADLMTMVLGTLSVPQSLAYAAKHDEGPVAEEMAALVSMLSSRALPDREAFERAADRLGTTYAKDFVSMLASAFIDGTSSVDAIRAQTASLRAMQFQSKRSYAKKAPVRMVGVFAIHFLPLLITLAFLPVFTTLSSIG